MKEADNTAGTTPKTLWTETILELLFTALKYEKSDREVKKILREVRMKGYKPSYIVNKVTKEVNEQAALRVKKIMQE